MVSSLSLTVLLASDAQRQYSCRRVQEAQAASVRRAGAQRRASARAMSPSWSCVGAVAVSQSGRDRPPRIRGIRHKPQATAAEKDN